MSTTRTKPLTLIGSILDKYKSEDKDDLRQSLGTRDKFVSREFQKYAYDLAVELNDLGHKSLYMRLCKDTPRGLLESARSFVADAQNAKSKGRLFMWKLSQLKAAKGNTQKESKTRQKQV